jgi:hypothetical protein
MRWKRKKRLALEYVNCYGSFDEYRIILYYLESKLPTVTAGYSYGYPLNLYVDPISSYKRSI